MNYEKQDLLYESIKKTTKVNWYKTSIARKHTTKLLVLSATISGFRIFSTDSRQAYTQTMGTFQTEVFIKPSKQFHFRHDQLSKITKPLYGLTESGDYQRWKFQNHLEENLGMETCITDGAVLYTISRDEFSGICASQVEVLFLIDNHECASFCKTTESKFTCKKSVWEKFNLLGQKQSHGSIVLKATKKNTYQHLRTFCWLQAKLLLIPNPLPDVCCAIALFAPVTAHCFEEAREGVVKAANNMAGHFMKTLNLTLQFSRFEKGTLRIRVYTDGSQALNIDKYLQLGYFIFLSNRIKNYQQIHLKSCKSKRMTRSVLGN